MRTCGRAPNGNSCRIRLPVNCGDNAAISLVVSDHCAELTIL
jgi:hypothetical protein